MSGYRPRSPRHDSYDNSHRVFLQAFMSQSVMTVDEMKPVIAKLLTAHEPDRQRLVGDITQQMITAMVQTVNAKIAPLDFEIRSARDHGNQHDKPIVYALVNTTSDALTQLATSFTPDEIAYIKRLLDAMFEENNTRTREVMAVKELKATQLAKAPLRNRQNQAADADAEGLQVEVNVKSITQAESDRVLSQLQVQGFLRKSRGNYYSLAPRALMELRVYLKETYNEPPTEDEEDAEPIVRIRDCEGCREIVTVGLRCSDRDCNVRWHMSCANHYFNNQQGNVRKCPKCKKDWTGDLPVGEEADRVGSRRSTNGRNSTMIEEDEEDE